MNNNWLVGQGLFYGGGLKGKCLLSFQGIFFFVAIPCVAIGQQGWVMALIFDQEMAPAASETTIACSGLLLLHMLNEHGRKI